VARTLDPTFPGDFPIRGWLASCSPQFRREFLALARPKSVTAGSVMFRAGDVGRDLFGIVSGVVLLEATFTHPDAALLHMLRAGDWLGMLVWISERSPRLFSAVARTDVELLHVPASEMNALLKRHPEATAELFRSAIWAMEVALQCAADLLIKDASARCAAVLLRMAGRRWASDPQADLPSEIPAAQAELAMLCNVSRKTFSRVVGEFSKLGLVTVGYKSLTVHDPAGLRLTAELGSEQITPRGGARRQNRS
jgi:CRP-like cAMP-binding protein